MKLKRVSDNQVLLSNLLIADTFLSRLIGLLNRKSLSEEEGLLFPKCSAIHTIGMKFPIDVIFMDRSGRVIKILSEFLPNRVMFWPVRGAYYVLEVKAGWCQANRVKGGDVLIWEE